MIKNSTVKILCSTLAAMGAAVAASDVRAAQPVKVDVGAGLEYHSNAGRVSTDEQSDVARIARVGVAWADPTGP
ncbi:MAG TPA: hypothetical protein VFM32_05135, partial [Spongiibacteraceae bacterium]|nr:hypothetical protein [Spongiibacteraceae bacterium]